MIDPDVVRDIAERYDEILSALREALSEIRVEPLKFWLWQGRARGKLGDDVDIYVQVDEKYSSLTHDLDLLNRKLRSKWGGSGYHWTCGNLLMDTRIGVGPPPERPYLDFSLVKKAYIHGVYFPQWRNLSFTDIFDAHVKHINPNYVDGGARSYMISCPYQNMVTGYWYGFYRSKLEKSSHQPRCEVLFGTRQKDGGIEPHDVTHEEFGTQPFGSYLRGHINIVFGIIVDGKWITPETEGFKPFITAQQYYKSDKMPGVDFLPQQVEITVWGIRKLMDVGLISPETRVHLEDHSHSWDQYICHPLAFIPARRVVDLYDKLPKDEVLKRWRFFAEYGKTYIDREKALRCFDV